MTFISILSPHIDDAVFSLGAYLEQLSKLHQLSVINVFSLHTFAFSKLMNTSTATRIRKAEDETALNAICVNSVHYLDLPEALLRGYSLDSQFTQPDNNRVVERNLISEISNHLSQLIPPGSIVLSPTAFGSHVDHVNVRVACERLDATLVYYADLPYAADSIRFRHENAAAFIRGMNKRVFCSSHEVLDRHIHLCRCYGSQFQQDFVNSMTSYLRQNHYTLWSHHGFGKLDLDIQ